MTPASRKASSWDLQHVGTMWPQMVQKGIQWIGGFGTQTQVPWWAGGRAFLLFKAWDLSLKSVGFCCETSISALATMIPEERKRKEKRISSAEKLMDYTSIVHQYFAASTVKFSSFLCLIGTTFFRGSSRNLILNPLTIIIQKPMQTWGSLNHT